MGPAAQEAAGEELAPPGNRMAVALLSLLGIFVALYLTAHAFGWTGPLRCGIGDCETVQASKWSKLGPVPVALIGLLGYVVLLALSVAGLQPGRRSSRSIGTLLFAGAAFGVLFSGWLTYLEAAVIHAWCQWCVTSAILILLVFLATLPELRRRT